MWLRPWRLDDLPALVAAHRDPALRRWLANSLAGETEVRQWLAAQAAGWDSATRFSFAVVAEQNDDAPVGHVVVKVGTAGVAEVGYWTAAPARGRGIAARAPETASQWALSTQDLAPLTLMDPRIAYAPIGSGLPPRCQRADAKREPPGDGEAQVRMLKPG